MAANYESGNFNSLLIDSKCYEDGCNGSDQREAIALYVKAESLAAAGGTDYTADLPGLLLAAKAWQASFESQREAIMLNLAIQNAIANGATIDTDVDALKSEALTKGALGVGREYREGVLTYLNYLISEQGYPY